MLWFKWSSGFVVLSWEGLLLVLTDVSTTWAEAIIRVMMASAQVVETSVNTNNNPSQDYTTNPDDHSNHNIDSPGFKPFTVLVHSSVKEPIYALSLKYVQMLSFT